MNRFITKTLIAAAAVVTLSGNASALSLSVKLACASDYYAHCSKHSPDSPGVRGCMSAAGPALSNRCVKALVGAGEISQAEVDRRRAASKTASR